MANMKRVLKEGIGEANMNKSRFYALLVPASNAEEVENALAKLKKDYPKADHYPYSYRLSKKGKSSDDGEPGSSAGRPLLTLLESEDLDDAFLGVARYFGGIKLGVGNLRRCFVDAAKGAIENATFGQEETRFRYEAIASYSEYQELERLSSRLGYVIEEREFLESVKATLLSPHPLEEPFNEKGLGHLLKNVEQILITVEIAK